VLKCRDLCQESNVSNTDEGLFFSAEENFHWYCLFNSRTSKTSKVKNKTFSKKEGENYVWIQILFILFVFPVLFLEDPFYFTVFVNQVHFLFLPAALKLLGEKTTLLSPEVVVASGIPCCRLVAWHICYAVMSWMMTHDVEHMLRIIVWDPWLVFFLLILLFSLLN